VFLLRKQGRYVEDGWGWGVEGPGLEGSGFREMGRENGR